MKNIFLLQKIVFTILGLSLAVPGISLAADNFRMNQQVVSYADLNLSRDVDVVTLYQRLKHAANDICGTREHRVGPRITLNSVQQQRRQCAAVALDQAVASVNNQHLTDLHNQAVAPLVVSR